MIILQITGITFVFFFFFFVKLRKIFKLACLRAILPGAMFEIEQTDIPTFCRQPMLQRFLSGKKSS